MANEMTNPDDYVVERGTAFCVPPGAADRVQESLVERGWSIVGRWNPENTAEPGKTLSSGSCIIAMPPADESKGRTSKD